MVAGSPASDDDFELSIRDVLVHDNGDGSLVVVLRTSRGDLPALLHPSEGSAEAVVFLSGASGGVDGPAERIYGRLAPELVTRGVSSLRLDYRLPNIFNECVLDTLGALSFLRGVGAVHLQLVGHSFGGAIAIKAAEIDQTVVSVAALSSQLYGTNGVASIAPRRVLVVHGLDDQVLEATAGQIIYDQAREPKRLILYPGTGHGLLERKDELFPVLLDWLTEHATPPHA
jgi:cephalosporin-C deacetylase-like acetyl esterase